MLHLLVVILSELYAGPLNIGYTLGCIKECSFKDFITFLQILEVYGSGYEDDVDLVRYNRINNYTHS